MDYNYELSLANIRNVVVALNNGGMQSCDDIMCKVWDEAPDQCRQDKIGKPASASKRTESYARKQLRQEVRRSLYSHFNDPERSGFDIFRATPHGDVEHFWVAEPQTVDVETVLEPTVEPVLAPISCRPVLSPNASLIERLNAANDTMSSSAQLIRDAVGNEVSVGTFINDNMPDGFAGVLTETLSEEFCGLPVNDSTKTRLAERIEGIIAELEAYHG